ncbi:hypothetical protein H072_5947 [Dactylellina haptotyla CBS 200.50]|uniref:Matrin-type domain-containing protein n=1 Tax=Dactylellina haptotyla (strain CBS 200.50) TaxID=1284197 RepID=S8BY55_DACHA|nr:hypothetical protein H072_5947 [Dactylellina haptotyla CBS 200.50]
MTTILENQRLLHEELERLEQAVADRLAEEARTIRDRLLRDHEVGHFLTRFENQSKRLFDLYTDEDGSREKEVSALSHGDPFGEFYRQLNEIRDFHRRYPNEPVEDLARTYKRRPPLEGEIYMIDNMFTGEEFHGRFFDLTQLHEEYLNLKGVKRISYLHYLSIFDKFEEYPKVNKNDAYFTYLTGLADYLEAFLRKTQPLSNPDVVIRGFGDEFDKAWEAGSVIGWETNTSAEKPAGVWCDACEKAFTNENTFNGHLNGNKHKKNAAAKGNQATEPGASNIALGGTANLKHRAIAEREFRIAKFTDLMSKEREDTKTNVERKASLTERERQAELDALFQDTQISIGAAHIDDDEDDDDEDKIYNPLKLPLAWDGKPIPFWLYKLHGLGVEYICEICGNFVYMGRRAFDKHFTEARHVHGLRCLGITNPTVFREITKIEDALAFNDKLKGDKKQAQVTQDNVVQMEDGEGNVMPEKVYYDLQKQGLL